jgi:hypothetical protein
MRLHGLFGLALAGLILLGGDRGRARAAEEGSGAFKPAVLVRLASLDDLIATARYLVKEAGREEMAKQGEKLLKARSGPKGLEGIDMKKPIGLYGSLASRLDRSQAVVLVPIADEEAFLKLLDSFGLAPEKGAGGLYTLNLGSSPFPILFRFANGYLYATVQFNDKVELPAADKLPQPSTVLAGGGGILSVTANIDRIPDQIRKIGISGSANFLGDQKEEKKDGETDAQKALRGAILDEAAMQTKAVLTDGGAVMLKLDVDRKAHDLSLSLSFQAKDGSPLAKNLAGLAAVKSVAAGLGDPHSALGGFLHVVLPEGIRNAMAPAIDEAIKAKMADLDEGARGLLTPLVDAITPTLKSGVLDIGVSVRGPGKDGKHTLVGSLQVKDGEGIEKAVRKVLDVLPDEAKKGVKLDVAKAEGVSIHSVKPENVNDASRELFGEGPVYVAFRKDAVIFSGGEDALEALKKAVAAEPKAGPSLEVDLSVKRAADLGAKVNPKEKDAVEAAKKAFKEKGSDRVRLSVTAGSKIELKLNVKTAVLTFASLVDKARKQAEAPKDTDK